MKRFFRLSLLLNVALFSPLFTLNAQHVSIDELSLRFNSADIRLSEEAERYIQSVVDIIRKDAIHKKELNFDHIHQAIRYYADGATKIKDTHKAIKKVMPMLRDHHSYFMTFEDVRNTLGLGSKEIEVIKNGKAPHADPTKVDSLRKSLSYASWKIIDGKVGYLSVPSFDNLYYEAMAMFTDSLQRVIQMIDQVNPVGWIIDLRNNSGGADMPMIAGLGPFLDSNNVYYSVDKEGKEQARFFYKDGGYYSIDAGDSFGNPLVQSTVKYQLIHKHSPVAILTNLKTASSAEAVTAIFAGQQNVKIIGSKTNGLTTVNNFNFLEDNSVVNLTIGYYANRHHEIYIQGIKPDLVVKTESKSGKTEADDTVLLKALQWITK